MKFFLQAKQKAFNVAPIILQVICDSFEERFGSLEDDGLVNKTATQRDTILNDICQCINTKSWITAPRSCVSKETFLDHNDSLKYIFNQFKDMSSLKTIALLKLEEQFIELIEYANKYYDVTKFNTTVQRFFNYMKIVKTDRRSQLNEKELEALL